MDKTSEKATKDPKRQEPCKKSHETNMKRLKEKIIEDNQTAYTFLYGWAYTFHPFFYTSYHFLYR